jgi:hypothetical protein
MGRGEMTLADVGGEHQDPEGRLGHRCLSRRKASTANTPNSTPTGSSSVSDIDRHPSRRALNAS